MKTLLIALSFIACNNIFAQTQLPITSSNLEGLWVLDSVVAKPSRCDGAYDSNLVKIEILPNGTYTFNKNTGPLGRNYNIEGKQLWFAWSPPSGEKILFYKQYWVEFLFEKALCLEYELACGKQYFYFHRE